MDGRPKIHDMGSGRWAFHCPGCNYGHYFEVPRWTWNGSVDAPTFTPSLLSNQSVPEQRCHLNMVLGKIQFHIDSHHELKGLVVDCPDWDE
jgi:hypothetical protein